MATTFSDLSVANPYSNQHYDKSGWQDFLSALGFRTESDAWKENMSVQAAEYEAALLQKQHDEEYNDPSNQVSRLRAAGLNPDLNAGSVDPGSPGAMGTDMSTPMQSTGDESQLMSVASGILSCFTSAVGMVSSFQGIHRNFLENKLLDLNIDKSSLGLSSDLSQLGSSIWKQFLPSNAEGEVYDDGSGVSWQSLAYERAKAFTKRNIPKKYRDAFLRNVQMFWNSAPGTKEAYEEWRSGISSRKGYEVDKRTNFSFADRDLSIIADELAAFHSKIEKQGLSTQLSELETREKDAEYKGEVIDNLDPDLEVSAKRSSFASEKESADFSKQLHSTVNRIIDKLSKNDDMFSKLLVVLISANSLGMLKNPF